MNGPYRPHERHGNEAQRLSPDEIEAIKAAHPIERMAASYDIGLRRLGPHL
jgi:hypothetical protein